MAFAELADRLARRAAVGVTRREALSTAGAGAFGAALGVAYLGKSPSVADAFGSKEHPCGPSPICPGSCCAGNGHCMSYSRVYNSSGSCTTTNGQCWTEDYRGSGGGLWQCCDCCCLSGSGQACSSCYNHKACICRKQIG